MIESEPALQRHGRPARSVVGVFQIWGALMVALVAGSRRAGKAIAFETVLGSSGVGALGALLVSTARNLLGRQHTSVLDALEIGAGMGACLGAGLYLFTLALEDRAKARKRSRFGDN